MKNKVFVMIIFILGLIIGTIGIGWVYAQNGLKEPSNVESSNIKYNTFLKTDFVKSFSSRSSSSSNPNAPWSTFNWPVRIMEADLPLRFFSDINGDGLPDLVSVNHAGKLCCNTPFIEMADHVFLSNGNGWELVYICGASCSCVNNVPSGSYWGNCAG